MRPPPLVCQQVSSVVNSSSKAARTRYCLWYPQGASAASRLQLAELALLLLFTTAIYYCYLHTGRVREWSALVVAEIKSHSCFTTAIYYCYLLLLFTAALQVGRVSGGLVVAEIEAHTCAEAVVGLSSGTSLS